MSDRRKRLARGLWEDPPASAQRLIWAGALLALAFCAYGSPWSTSFVAGAAVTALSALALGALVLLTRATRDEALRLVSAARDEWNLFDARLTSNADSWRKFLRDSRAAAHDAARGGPARLPAVALPDGLARVAMAWVQRRFAGGEGLRCDVLRDHLENSSVLRVDRLQKYHEWAFSLGVLGAVLGLGAQVWVVQQMSEGGFLGAGFLSGVVLKAAVSVVGVAVALYARSLRWRQMEGYDRLSDRLEEFVTTQIGPVFSEVAIDDGNIVAALRDAAERIERTGRSLEERLPAAVAGPVEVAAARVERAAWAIEERLPAAIATAVVEASAGLKDAVAQELGAALRREVAQPFRAAMLNLTDSVASCTAAIQETSAKFRESMDSLQREVRAAIGERDAALTSATNTINVLATVPDALERVVREIQKSVADLRAYRGELENSIHVVRQQHPDSPVNGHSLHDHLALAETLLEAIRVQYAAGRPNPAEPLGRN